MTYTFLTITGQNLEEIYAVKIGAANYSFVGPYSSTGDFIKSVTGTPDTFFTKISGNIISILAPPIHRNAEPIKLISNDRILELTNTVFASAAPVITGASPNPQIIGQAIKIEGRDFLGAETVIFGNDANALNFKVNPDGKTIVDCVVPENAGSGFLKVVNFNNVTGTSSFPFYPFPKIDKTSETSITGLIGSSVTIAGKSLNHITGVRFNSVLAESFTVDSNSKITATVPSGAVNGRISVSGYSGTFDISQYNFEAIPLITGQSPLTGERNAATTLLITGLIPELLHSVKTGTPTGYAVIFQGSDATGAFYIDGNGKNLTGIVPPLAKKGLVKIIKNNIGETYFSSYVFNITGAVPDIKSINPKTGKQNFTVIGNDFFDITGVELKHKKTNKTYNLPSGTQPFLSGFLIENANNDIDSKIIVKGLTGKFFEKNSSSFLNLEEGKYDLILTNNLNVSYTFSGNSGTFYLAGPPVISGFGPLSIHLGQQINVTGTGLYPNKTNIFYNCHDTGTENFTRIQIVPDVLSKFNTFSEDNRSGFFTISKNFQETIFGSDPFEVFPNVNKEFVTGFLTFENNFYPSPPASLATGNATGIIPLTVFNAPYISGISPNIATIGNTITLSGYGFRDISSLNLFASLKPKKNISTFNVVGTTGINFEITQDIYNSTAGENTVEIINPFGSVFSQNSEPEGFLLLTDFPPIGSGFIPQPAQPGTLVILTGFNLKSVGILSFVATDSSIIDLEFTTGSLNINNFTTGSGIGTGTFLTFLSPFDVKNDEFVKLNTFEGISIDSLTKFRNEFPLLFGISGLSGLVDSFTGIVGDVFGITGSGFSAASAKVLFGKENLDAGLFKQASNQEIVNNNLIKATIEPGINGVLFLSGSIDQDLQLSQVNKVITLLPQISGVKNTILTEGDTFVVTGINNFDFSGENIFTGDMDLRLSPEIKLAITGVRYGSTSGEVEYINYNVSGFKQVNSDLEFSGMVNSEFAGTGRLFLIDLLDRESLGLLGSDTSDTSSTYNSTYIFNSGFFESGFTKNFLPRILNTFDQTVTINEKQSTISGFSPSVAKLEANVTISGTSLRAVTGVALFSGSTVSSSSIPFDYKCLYHVEQNEEIENIPPVNFYPINFGVIKFAVPANYALSSGRIRLLSKNYNTDSNQFLKIIKTAASDAIFPTGGVAGDLITLNGSSFIDITGVKFVDLDGEFATGLIIEKSDTRINVIVPNEGRLPAPQIVSIVASQADGDFNLGDFEVRQGSEKFLGNIVVTGNISGANFLGAGVGGRPTVNGSGVLLVGEATLGSGTTISITGGLDTDSASQIFTGDGSKKLFGLNSGIHTGIKGSTQQIRSSSVLVSIDGLMQNPVEHYTIIDPLGGTSYSGLQFTSIPISGADIEVRRFGDTVTVDITGNGISKKQSIIYALVLG